MFKFYIKGFAACNDPYYYSSSCPVDIKVNAETKAEAITKAEKVLGHKIHRSTMRITIEEGGE
jgi:hypothetical protein